MGGEVITRPTWHHGKVRLRLGFLVESDRGPGSDVPTPPERGFEDIPRQSDGGRVARALALLDDDLAADQLEALGRMEDAELAASVVLGPSPTSFGWAKDSQVQLGNDDSGSTCRRREPEIRASKWRSPVTRGQSERMASPR